MSLLFYTLFIIIASTIASPDSSSDDTTNLFTRAVSGYAAIMQKFAQIYDIPMSYTKSKSNQEWKRENYLKRKEEELTNEEEDVTIDELMNELNINIEHNNNNFNKNKKAKRTFTEHFLDFSNAHKFDIPFLDRMIGHTQDDGEDEHNIQYNADNNPQQEYIRRRLKEYEEPIICNNTKSNYPTDYSYIFDPFPNCTINDTSLYNISYDATFTTQTLSNDTDHNYIPILYSPDCSVMFILNKFNGELQIIASQMMVPLYTSGNDTVYVDPDVDVDYYYAHFNSLTGGLIVYDSDDNPIFDASHTSTWRNSTFYAPYSMILSDVTVYIIDSNDSILWNTLPRVSHWSKQRDRFIPYTLNLTSMNGDVLYSIDMEQQFSIVKKRLLYLGVEYIEDSFINDISNATIKTYIDMILAADITFNVSVYEISSTNIGDHYVIYDSNLPMIHTLSSTNQYDKLNIAETHTFLCLDNQTRYFKVEVLPYSNTQIIHHGDTNYTLILIPNTNVGDNNYAYIVDEPYNYTFPLKPWNPCNDGLPVLAQKSDRHCSNYADRYSAINKYNEFVSNVAYSSINIKSIFDIACANQIVNGKSNISNISSITFPSSWSDSSSCEEYIILNDTINEYFNSTYCDILRSNCPITSNELMKPAYYLICFDYISNLCPCYCPRDKKGNNCENDRSFNCKLNILNANQTECELMTQSELNEHGRSDYDVNIDGDKPCFFINDDDEYIINSTIQLHCEFEEGSSISSRVWESLDDYIIYDNNTWHEFSYCLGNETSSFALMSAPPSSYIRIKIFNFARIFSDDETTIISLPIEYWSGDKYIYHNKSMKDLLNDYKIGGRVYIEYQLYHDPGNRIHVERRFYDIDHWKMPNENQSKLDNEQKWFVALITIAFIIMIIYCVYKCNRLCQTLEHEKND